MICSTSILSREPHFFGFQCYSGHKIVYRRFGSLPDLGEVKPREPIFGMWSWNFMNTLSVLFSEPSRDHELYICNPLAPRARSRLSSCLSILMFLTLKYNFICCWNNANVTGKSGAFQFIMRNYVVRHSGSLMTYLPPCNKVNEHTGIFVSSITLHNILQCPFWYIIPLLYL